MDDKMSDTSLINNGTGIGMRLWQKDGSGETEIMIPVAALGYITDRASERSMPIEDDSVDDE